MKTFKSVCKEYSIVRRCFFILQGCRGNIKTLFRFLSFVFFLLVVSAQASEILTIEKINPKDPVIRVKSGKKVEFKVKAESINGWSYPIERIQFVATEDPEVFGREKDWCVIFCGADDHKVKYRWGNVLEAEVTATVYSKNQLAKPKSVSWTVKISNYRPEEANKPRAEIRIIKAQARKIRFPALSTDPYTIWSPGEKVELTVGSRLYFEVEATCDDGIEFIQFSNRNPDNCLAFCETYSVTKRYTFKTVGRRTITAMVKSKEDVLHNETKWSVNVVPEGPKSPDLTVWVSRIDQAISTVSVLSLSGSNVQVPHVDQGILVPSGRFQLEATVRNSGSVESRPTNLRFYLSSNSDISAKDTLLRGKGSIVWALKVGGEITITPPGFFVAPKVPGVYYYGACVDSVGDELDVDNNCSGTIAITVRSSDRPDLVVGSISANKDTLTPGGSFTLTATVLNQGTGASTPTTLGFYRSSNPNISANDDTALPKASIGKLNNGGQITRQKVLTAPDEPGVYYYGACVADVQGESNTSNNCSEAVAITVQAPDLPDLIVESIWTSKVSLDPGEGFTLYARVRNQGTVKSPTTRLYYYGPNGSEIGSTLTKRLSPNAVSEKSLSLTAPDSLGTYTYMACVNSVGNEVNLDNNCSVIVSVTVGQTAQNRSPSAVGSTPVQMLTANTAARHVDVSIYFHDPDGDRLTYTARSDNMNVATASASGDEVRITPRVAGSATVTVTASDGALSATQRFSVTVRVAPVRNQAPVAVGIIPVQSMTVGAAGAVQVSGYFSDLNGDSLTYTAVSGNTNVVTTRVSGAYLTITPVRVGSATVTVTASDGVLSATQRFSVTVRVAPVRNQAPVAVGIIPVQSMTVGAAGAVQVSGYFSDLNGDSLTYTAVSGNTNVVTTRVSGAYLTITPVRVGSATVTVTASDGALSATQRFSVTVRVAPVRNQAPAAIGTIAPQTLMANSGVRRVNVSSYFRDSDGDSLTYTANSDNTNVATVSVSGAQITITPQRTGSTTIHVTASDGALSTTQSISVTVASTPPQPDPTSFDLAIQSVTVSKDTLVPGESFTLSVTIENNGPGVSEAASLSYYHSLILGRTPTDTVRLQGQVDLDSLASGASITKVIRLDAPSTPRTYYYGAWLSANSGDTNLFNDVATEIGVTVRAVQAPDVPDLVVQSTRVSESTLAPGESFKFYATVINSGTDPAGRTTLRYYRSTDSQISTGDTEVDTDSIDSLNPDETDEVWDSLSVPSSPGTYYYGVCIDSVSSESNTNNNCSNAIRITVQPPGPPDLIVESVSVEKQTLEPGERFRFDATVRNQGTGESEATDLHYYLSTNSNISDTDTHERRDSVGRLDPDETNEEWSTLTAPDSAGIYYFGACVESVSGESNTNNNCSTAVRITVQTSPPDLVVESISASESAVEPGESFRLSATVRNQGSGEARSTTLRYYRSANVSISDSDTEVDTDSVSSLDADETSDEWDSLTAPSTAGVYYYGACVDSVSGESNTSNNCSTAIRITVADAIIVRPRGLDIGDSVFAQNTVGGGFNGLRVRSGAGTGFDIIGGVWDDATGTITDGPETANGYTWWKVRWNRSNKVACDVNPCEGWSVEIFNGTRVIAKQGLAAPTLKAPIPTETVLLSNYPNPFNPGDVDTVSVGKGNGCDGVHLFSERQSNSDIGVGTSGGGSVSEP